MEFGVIEILLGLGILFLCLYFHLTSNSYFWKKLNVKGPKHIPFFGSIKDVVFGKCNFAVQLDKFYKEFKNEPIFGYFSVQLPTLVIIDTDLVKDVLIKDFQFFCERAIPIFEKAEPVTLNLVNLEYKRWKPLRSKLSPIFTSGRLKDMFYLITDCADNFQKYIEKLAEKGKPIEVRDLVAKFTTDSIGVCAFGLDTNSIGDEDSEFRKYGKAFFDLSARNKLRKFWREMFPKSYDAFGGWILKDVFDFFYNTMMSTIQYRKSNNLRRHDFLDLLVDLQNDKDKLDSFELTDTLLFAQAMTFFLAGFETSSSAMSHTLYELALNQNIQDKLREEINTELEMRNGKFTYDSIKNMKYLDKIIKETLRKYPVAPATVRKSVAPYTFNGLNVTIPKDVAVVIPVLSFHRDPEIYPEPDLFDPERFNEENVKKRNPMHYLPFGEGPRNCIGARFANYQSKIGIASIIEKFRVSICEETCKTYIVEPRSNIISPKGGFILKITKL